MFRFRKIRPKPPAPNVNQARPESVSNMAEMAKRLGLDTAPATMLATWPTGVSLLAQAVDACQRCDAGEVCGDWLARAPDSIKVPPEFCANAETFTQAKKAKERD